MGQPVMQWQILSRDPDATAAFYRELFGWSVDRDNALGYRRVHTGSPRGIGGGIWPVPPEGQGFVQLFVEVDDVHAHAGRVEALGGRVIVPPQTTPDGEVVAIVHDDQGIPLALFSPASP